MNVSFSDATGLNATGTSGDVLTPLEITYPSNYEVECTISSKSTSYSGALVVEGVFIEANTSNKINVSPFGDSATQITGTLSVSDVIKIIKNGDGISFYKNGTLLATRTRNSSYNGFAVRTYVNRNIGIKNLKIKPL